MKKNYPYLKDVDFLNKIYGLHSQTMYTNITVLKWDETPIQEVTGRVVSASISVNGDSSVRRTANLTVKIKNNNELFTNIDSLFSINKKVFIELGLRNPFTRKQYSDYPIVYFPFGVFIITSESITHDSTGISLSLTLGDKMNLLNGYAGGTIPASTNFESYDTVGPDGDITTEFTKINEIIREVVNHFGQQPLNNIIVNDVDNKIKQVEKWTGTNPAYIYQDKNNKNNVIITTVTTTGFNTGQWSKRKIIQGYDIGYKYTDFTYPGELTAAAGDSVCTVLDKIKGILGNYEYYFDVFGNFIFQEIKNYVNVSEDRTIVQNTQGLNFFQNLNNPDNEDFLPYAYNTRLNSHVYDFNNNEFVISYNNNPSFNMVKNDFIVWGVRKGIDDIQYPCRYHLAIDSKPHLDNDLTLNFPIVFDISVEDKIKRVYDLKTTYSNLKELKENQPTGVVGTYYYLSDEDTIYSWVTDMNRYYTKVVNYLKSIGDEEGAEIVAKDIKTSDNSSSINATAGYVKCILATPYGTGETHPNFVVSKDTDWRNILYFQGFIASIQGLSKNYYYQELYNEWPKLYDTEGGTGFKQEIIDCPTSIDYWLDFIDNDSSLKKFSVDVIGRRTYAKTESGCNCVFEPDIPDIVILKSGSSDIIDARTGDRTTYKELGLVTTQVDVNLYDSLQTGGTYNSCYQNIRQLLTDYTDYNNKITMTTLPIYHLEPNTRIAVKDPDSGIYGDYIINSISYTLGNNNTMSISATKVNEKI